eukprot:scaffold62014_cov54-Phaeocystis_antarctica.AAC.4
MRIRVGVCEVAAGLALERERVAPPLHVLQVRVEPRRVGLQHGVHEGGKELVRAKAAALTEHGEALE